MMGFFLAYIGSNTTFRGVASGVFFFILLLLLFFSTSRSPLLRSASSHPTSPPLNAESRGSQRVLKRALREHNGAGTLDLKEDSNE